jgi:integrase
LEIPASADVVSFLLSNGRVAAPLVVTETVTLRNLFRRYFASIPDGSLEQNTIEGMRGHQKVLEKHLGYSFPIRTLTIEHLREYVRKRSHDKGVNGRVTGTTIRKAIVTLRTVWNFGLQERLVEGIFPSRGLKYPKTKEKPPYMPFQDVLKRTNGGASELWECVYLTPAELSELLIHVKKVARHPFIYPMFVFCGHTGARRSEMARAKISDLDFNHGQVTIHERKRRHDAKTTRRIPMSGLLRTVMKEWLKIHPGSDILFRHAEKVSRSKTKNRASIQLTRDELHDHFKRTLAGSKWEMLKGHHTLRHSFCSALAEAGTPQHIIDEFMSHSTDEQRRRYKHLLPSSKEKAIVAVFG